jgi:hypothetical protein
MRLSSGLGRWIGFKLVVPILAVARQRLGQTHLRCRELRNDAGGRLFDLVDFAEALSVPRNFAGNPANISVSHRQGRLTGLASPDPVGSVF